MKVILNSVIVADCSDRDYANAAVSMADEVNPRVICSSSNRNPSVSVDPHWDRMMTTCLDGSLGENRPSVVFWTDHFDKLFRTQPRSWGLSVQHVLVLPDEHIASNVLDNAYRYDKIITACEESKSVISGVALPGKVVNLGRGLVDSFSSPSGVVMEAAVISEKGLPPRVMVIVDNRTLKATNGKVLMDVQGNCERHGCKVDLIVNGSLNYTQRKSSAEFSDVDVHYHPDRWLRRDLMGECVGVLDLSTRNNSTYYLTEAHMAGRVAADVRFSDFGGIRSSRAFDGKRRLNKSDFLSDISYIVCDFLSRSKEMERIFLDTRHGVELVEMSNRVRFRRSSGLAGIVNSLHRSGHRKG